jgi:hypothetical protein
MENKVEEDRRTGRRYKEEKKVKVNKKEPRKK